MSTTTQPKATIASAAPRFTLAMFVWLKPNGAAVMAEFASQAASLFATYDLRVERRLSITGKSQVVGENRFESPDVIQLLSFPSVEAFKAYVTDPQYVELAKRRDDGIRRLTVMSGFPLDLEHLSTPGSGPAHTRLYGVGLARFLENGYIGMDAFNAQAQGLFARHGMHLESILSVGQVMTPIGEPNDMDPQRIVVFFLDQAAALPGYASDPEYQALAPLRDDGLETYDLFLGVAPAPSEAVVAIEVGK